MYSVETPDDGQ